MSQMLGMDVGAVRNLATQLNTKADEIQQIQNTLTGLLNNVQWVGTDANNFRSEWSGTHTSQLQQVINALRDASTKATTNANEQETASGS